jgi:hypothetical protein
MDDRRIELRFSADAETRFYGAHPAPYTVVMGWSPPLRKQGRWDMKLTAYVV